MCVGNDRSHDFGRAEFFGVVASAAAPFFLATTDPVDALSAAAIALPVAPAALRAGNARAVHIARNAPFIHATYARVDALARSIVDDVSRADILQLLADPVPTFAKRFDSRDAQRACQDELAFAGFLDPLVTLEQLFPLGARARDVYAPQPFWTTPGSSDGSHHGYPGGLAVHEYFNATIATAFSATYDRTYFSDTKTVDRDLVVAAALYHDIMKAVIFQWGDDGMLTPEVTIGGTGAHHTFSAAEAIARGRDARFIITLLSAHAAPSLGEEAKVVTWCRAAAILAGVDPVAYGLLRKTTDGFALAPRYVPIESFITHLADHDYVLAVHAMHDVSANIA